MSYYNERNGWVDNGKKLHNDPCPNCGSHNFQETVSREYCPDCGMECNYWSGGSNEVYDAMCKRKWAAEEERREAEVRKYYEDHYGDWGDDDY